MVGTVLDSHGVALDYWQRAPGISVFFLSHMHADHTVGLKPSWNMGRIYCTPLSKRLLVHKFQVDPEIVTTIEYGVANIVRVSHTDCITVTAFDANHCPGAAMFLIQGSAGNVLYTGDFRYSARVVDSFDHPLFLRSPQPPTCATSRCSCDDLIPLGHGPFECSARAEREGAVRRDEVVIDTLYVDNTYCAPMYDRFPARTAAADAVVEIARQHPSCRVFIAIDTLGKEELLVRVAQALDERVGVCASRMAAMGALAEGGDCDIPDVFTTDPLARVRVVQRHMVTPEALARWNDECPTIVVVATAMPIAGNLRSWRPESASAMMQGNTVAASQPVADGFEQQELPLQYVFTVPYSLHSSFSELRAFVSRLRVRQVRPIVPRHNADVEHYFGDLLLPELSRDEVRCVPVTLSATPLAAPSHERPQSREAPSSQPACEASRHRMRGLEAPVLLRRHSSKGPSFAGLSTRRVADTASSASVALHADAATSQALAAGGARERIAEQTHDVTRGNDAAGDDLGAMAALLEASGAVVHVESSDRADDVEQPETHDQTPAPATAPAGPRRLPASFLPASNATHAPRTSTGSILHYFATRGVKMEVEAPISVPAATSDSSPTSDSENDSTAESNAPVLRMSSVKRRPAPTADDEDGAVAEAVESQPAVKRARGDRSSIPPHIAALLARFGR
eukprot:Opistho-1_new@6403